MPTTLSIFINFPDPWPKDKHAKNRIIQNPFVKEMKRVCKDDAQVTLVTDHQEYSLQIIEEMRKEFLSSFPDPFYSQFEVEYGSSYFYRYFEMRGKEIRKMQFGL